MTKAKRNFNTNTINKEEWLTPLWVITALGQFDLDPCAPIIRPWAMAKKHYTIEDDGLTKPWEGRVWLNPPYSTKTFIWLKKLSEHKSGIALIFARTETQGFHRQIWEKAHSVFFFEKRLRFCTFEGKSGNCANAPSCLVSYSEYDTNMIKKSQLLGRLVIL